MTDSRAVPGGAAPALSRPRQLLVLLLTAAAVAGLDHLTKWLVTAHLILGQNVPAFGPISVHHIENRGAAFGVLPGGQFVFLAVALLVAVYILVAGHRFGPGLFPQLLLGLVLGGAVSNAVDRLSQGYVVDFIDLQRWPVFNVADMAIVVGILVGALTLRTMPSVSRSGGSA